MKMASSISMSTVISLQSAQTDRKSRKLPSRTHSRPPVNHVPAIAHRADVKKRGPPPSSGVSYPHRPIRYLTVMITGVQPSRSRPAGRRACSASPLHHNVTFAASPETCTRSTRCGCNRQSSRQLAVCRSSTHGSSCAANDAQSILL
jgi:hypothetical protein